ncbi:MAG TPA: hypothetical protein VF624_07535 [Tepidisphaeraceae bacterium]|jgi:hypothetical protein
MRRQIPDGTGRAGGYYAGMEERDLIAPTLQSGRASFTADDARPTRPASLWSSSRWIARRLPRVLLNSFLVLLIVGLLAACYAPVYFGSDGQGRAARRGR